MHHVIEGAWQGVVINSLKFQQGPPWPTLWPYGRFRGGPPAGWWRAAVFYPLEQPTPYAYACDPHVMLLVIVGIIFEGT
jgi:hypothetical protein